MRELRVNLKHHPYSLLVGRGTLKVLGTRLKRLGLAGKVMILTDRKVARYYLRRVRSVLERAGFQTYTYDSLPLNESAKSEKSLFEIYARLVHTGFDRTSFLVALGGGMVGDVAGFAASTYMRGIPWVVVPTTLLAQVDSSIGGKTAINLPEGKNLVGTFYQPKLVLADMDFLRTLPELELCHALAEVIKYAVIWDADFFSFLEKHIAEARKKNLKILERIVYECARIKKMVVERDECEVKNLRMILNYGHTFAHAFEAASETWTSSIPHGEAVAVGMVAAAELAYRQGLFSRKSQIRQLHLIRAAGLPVRLRKNLVVSRVLKCMQHDKKMHRGKLRFILPIRMGKVTVSSDVPLSFVRHAIQGLSKS